MGPKSPDKVDVEVGQRIRTQRNAIGLSQTALAEELGVTFQQVQKYEKGVNRVGAGRLSKIAEALDVPVSKLLGVDQERGVSAESPLKLLKAPGALRLLSAFGKVDDRVLRRTIVAMVERLAEGG